MLRIYWLSLGIVFLLLGCTNPEEAKKLEQEIEKVNQNITDSITENSKYGEGSALHTLTTLRLSIYKQTLAMLEQKKAAWYFPRFSYSVDGKQYSPPDDLASKISTLETELTTAQKEVDVAREKASNAGGVIGLLAVMDAETKALTVSQLNYQLIAFRNGFPPYLTPSSNGDSASPTIQSTSKSLNPTEPEIKTVNISESVDKNTEQQNQTSGPKDFRRTTWGMSKSQVKATETGLPSKDDDSMLVYKEQVSGKDALIAYIFTEDKLVRAKYIFVEKHSNENDHITDYDDLKEALEKKYGKSKDTEKIWRNELYKSDYSKWGFAVGLGHLVYYTSWKTENTDIILGLSGENYEVKLVAEYSSIALDGLEKKAREEKRASEL